MIDMMFHALQEQAKKSDFMLFTTNSGQYVVADLIRERVVTLEGDIREVADLLGGICIKTLEERIADAKKFCAPAE